MSDWAENVAKQFHEAYERLAPDHGYETRKDSAVPWEAVPRKNRDLMVATVEAVFEYHDHVLDDNPDSATCDEFVVLLSARQI